MPVKVYFYIVNSQFRNLPAHNCVGRRLSVAKQLFNIKYTQMSKVHSFFVFIGAKKARRASSIANASCESGQFECAQSFWSTFALYAKRKGESSFAFSDSCSPARISFLIVHSTGGRACVTRLIVAVPTHTSERGGGGGGGRWRMRGSYRQIFGHWVASTLSYSPCVLVRVCCVRTICPSSVPSDTCTCASVHVYSAQVGRQVTRLALLPVSQST